MKINNSLNKSKSRYLQQHKNNPVAWQVWSDETLKLAKEVNKPLFISIGYSSCHWCHVMAHESFEDEETANFLNNHFIPIKIDKEEYPEIDKKYQFYIQLIKQQGGWPLSVFTTPVGDPFYAGTYFPKEEKYGLPSFMNILNQIHKIYTENYNQIEESVSKYKGAIAQFYKIDKIDIRNLDLNSFIKNISDLLDFENGGLKGRNKFPNIPYLNFLLDFHFDEFADFLIKTARKISLSGLYDHINGGFFRYCVDENWSYPHFEKMLYDNALNTIFLIKLYDKVKDPLFYHISRKTIDFILETFNTEYGLISSMDADSLDENNHMVEGYFYHLDESLINIIPQDLKKYIVSKNGFIYLNDKTDYETYKKLEIYFDKISLQNKKIEPEKDNKVICSWNMLFVNALLTFAEVTGEEYYFNHAINLFNKIKTFLLSKEHIYRINYGDEIFKHETLEDYSYSINALLKLYEMTKEKDFLYYADAITKKALEKFTDDNYIYLDKNKSILDTFDDAMYSPAGLMGINLLNLSKYTSINQTSKIYSFLIDRAVKYPTGHPTLLSFIRRFLGDN
ncbi:DUF255 domain-containing protein [Deferribacter thermophilus]|uniref:thioredoxin domain-containing protein n=1 Tax=Deferribacter thermophilus TaxID=53573 RepID=UPI003C26CF3C